MNSNAWREQVTLGGVVGYLLLFNWDRLATHFAADDMMNMAIYYRLGFWRVFESQFAIWKGFYRPMGAAFYLPLYHWFGLNPQPFQAAIISLLAVNLFLEFRLAKALGCGGAVSCLAALTVSYHGGLTNLYYNIDMIYDVLCFTFFVGGLAYYIQIRGKGRLLKLGELAIYLALYIFALNSKEMALTMPAVLLVYELSYHRPARWGSTEIMKFVKGQARPAMLTAAPILPYLYGKKFGLYPMMSNPEYRPVFSLHRLLDFQRASLYDLFAHLGTFAWPGVVAIWFIVTYLAWRRDRPVLRFSWACMLLTPLPIEFLNGRVQGCLYIPLAAWAIFTSVVLVDLACAASRFLSNEPLFRHLGYRGVFASLIMGVILLWVGQMRYLRGSLVDPAAAREGAQTWEVIQQLRVLHPQVRPFSKVLFTNDPFSDWDMTFIGMLWFRDGTIQIYNQRHQHLPMTEIAKMDSIFDFRDGKLVQVK